ncbi:MAG: bifunctional UDP-N-acetylglucosamine diphosphorylase/glucosamine-1-phosphate N-acetyltransferase GlmU, partial [Gammaproteobacteria bacterium]|nr:bifunctional UDP-N-acetylglucosamine diphosphorylase/glucosamine-1-phosphate N-acetyltransferase GlmU [Gammaproteobacteria bacterium]
SDKENPAINILSFIDANPTGYGRIVRHDGQGVTGIVEEKDASDEIRKITECNSGIMIIQGNAVENLLSQLDNNNQQKEYYLTDVVKHAVNASLKVKSTICPQPREVLGVNNQVQLEQLESIRREWISLQLMTDGVKLFDSKRIDVRGHLSTGENVTIDVNCIFNGECSIGNNVKIGAGCVINNTSIGDDCEILPNCVIEDSQIENKVTIGPFARIRPETVLQDNSKVGNFVEIKKSTVGVGSKVNHLTYIGDCTIGKGVNIGAGVITCNYDGAYKHQTIIEDDVFVGSDCQLVAPVTLAKGSTIGAGSTITKNTSTNQLALSRSKQISIKGWDRPKKEIK